MAKNLAESIASREETTAVETRREAERKAAAAARAAVTAPEAIVPRHDLSASERATAEEKIRLRRAEISKTSEGRNRLIFLESQSDKFSTYLREEQSIKREYKYDEKRAEIIKKAVNLEEKMRELEALEGLLEQALRDKMTELGVENEDLEQALELGIVTPSS